MDHAGNRRKSPVEAGRSARPRKNHSARPRSTFIARSPVCRGLSYRRCQPRARAAAFQRRGSRARRVAQEAECNGRTGSYRHRRRRREPRSSCRKSAPGRPTAVSEFVRRGHGYIPLRLLVVFPPGARKSPTRRWSCNSLRCASTKSGCSSCALAKLASASGKRRSSFRIMPRWLNASASSGRLANAASQLASASSKRPSSVSARVRWLSTRRHRVPWRGLVIARFCPSPNARARGECLRGW